jgi:hypothetical protein
MSASRAGQAEDDFQRAAAPAVAEVGHAGWFAMTPREQTRSIYAQLRRIDTERVRGLAASRRRNRMRGVPE